MEEAVNSKVDTKLFGPTLEWVQAPLSKPQPS